MGNILLALNEAVASSKPSASSAFFNRNRFKAHASDRYANEHRELIEHCKQLLTSNMQLRARQQEIEEDLARAACVQRTLEPKPIMWNQVRVNTFYQQARSIGGDFGLISAFQDRHLDLLLCDVSGHGITAALAASLLHAETRTRLQHGMPLRDLLSELNDFVLHHINSSSFFFTLAAVRFERSGRHITFAGAGHPPCIVVRPGGDPQMLDARSMILGALPNAVSNDPTIEVDLEPGDRIVLYTDGVTEAFDAHGEMLGVEGLIGFVRECALLPFEEMQKAILDRIAEWRQGPGVDDASLMLAEIAA